ncbi:MAG: nicotinate-nucleotide adenylyltransferase [Actinobacteria bacterium]|nr:nicotinate-nucleotide adenylyltransferase [Actinomycetota bacterium]MCL5444438.1 nicotinate-nucleotide adenylyltransferase [Actinomycetota bacterium]
MEPDQPERSQRIGVFGGTFDPPHLGHVRAALAAMEQLELDRVLFVVSNYPWQKAPSRPVSPAKDRLAMVEAAIFAHPGLEVSRLEIDRGGPSYTVDTVEEILRQEEALGHRRPEIFVVIGADLLETLRSWEKPERLAEIATVAVVSRPGAIEPIGLPGWRVVTVVGPGVEISSSEVRTALSTQGADDERFVGMLSESVVRYIRGRSLYAGTR